MQRTGRNFVRRLAIVASLLAAGAAVAADPDPGAAGARAAELSRNGRFEDAALAWREAAQGFSAEGKHPEQISALVRLADAQSLVASLPGPLLASRACP